MYLEASMHLAKTSRPRLSVPNKWVDEGGRSFDAASVFSGSNIQSPVRDIMNAMSMIDRNTIPVVRHIL